MEKASASGAEGCGFESHLGCHDGCRDAALIHHSLDEESGTPEWSLEMTEVELWSVQSNHRLLPGGFPPFTEEPGTQMVSECISSTFSVERLNLTSVKRRSQSN